MAMISLKHTVIELPKHAFHKPSMARPYSVKVGGNGRTLHDFFLDTSALLTGIEPHGARYPNQYFFLGLQIVMENDRVKEIKAFVED